MSKAPSIDSSTFAVAGASNVTSPSLDSESVSSYGASSTVDEQSDSEVFNSFNSVDYLHGALKNAIDGNSSILDRALVIQAQTSGILKAKSVELRNLEAEIASKLETLKANIEGTKKDSSGSFNKMFSNCQRNLMWCEKMLVKMGKVVEDEYPIEYNEARDKVMRV